MCVRFLKLEPQLDFSLLTRELISCSTFKVVFVNIFQSPIKSLLKFYLILLYISLPFLPNMLFQACQFENIPLSIINEIRILI